MRNLLLFLLVLYLIHWVRQTLRRQNAVQQQTRRTRVEDPPRGERMLACALCGVHVPESEGLLADGSFYCCAEHRQQARG